MVKSDNKDRYTFSTDLYQSTFSKFLQPVLKKGLVNVKFIALKTVLGWYRYSLKPPMSQTELSLAFNNHLTIKCGEPKPNLADQTSHQSNYYDCTVSINPKIYDLYNKDVASTKFFRKFMASWLKHLSFMEDFMYGLENFGSFSFDDVSHYIGYLKKNIALIKSWATSKQPIKFPVLDMTFYDGFIMEGKTLDNMTNVDTNTVVYDEWSKIWRQRFDFNGTEKCLLDFPNQILVFYITNYVTNVIEMIANPTAKHVVDRSPFSAAVFNSWPSAVSFSSAFLSLVGQKDYKLKLYKKPQFEFDFPLHEIRRFESLAHGDSKKLTASSVKFYKEFGSLIEKFGGPQTVYPTMKKLSRYPTDPFFELSN